MELIFRSREALGQGLGLGLVFMPLNGLAFAGLPPHFRTEGSSLLNLTRNIGASVGISAVSALLAQSIQRSHQYLGEHVTATTAEQVREVTAVGETAAHEAL